MAYEDEYLVVFKAATEEEVFRQKVPPLFALRKPCAAGARFPSIMVALILSFAKSEGCRFLTDVFQLEAHFRRISKK